MASVIALFFVQMRKLLAKFVRGRERIVGFTVLT